MQFVKDERANIKRKMNNPYTSAVKKKYASTSVRRLCICEGVMCFL